MPSCLVPLARIQMFDTIGNFPLWPAKRIVVLDGEVVVDDLDVGGLVVCYPDFVDYCPIFVDLDYYGEAVDRAIDTSIHDSHPDHSHIVSSHRLGYSSPLYIGIGRPQVEAYCSAGNALPRDGIYCPGNSYPPRVGSDLHVDDDPHTRAARHPDSEMVDDHDHPVEDDCDEVRFGVPGQWMCG